MIGEGGEGGERGREGERVGEGRKDEKGREDDERTRKGMDGERERERERERNQFYFNYLGWLMSQWRRALSSDLLHPPSTVHEHEET